jgi:integrase/recombinase XerD
MTQDARITPTTIEDFLEAKKEYGLEHQKELSANTLKAYSNDLHTMLDYFKDQDITRESMIDYRDYLKANWKPESVNRKIRTANQYVTWAGIDAKIQNVKLVRNMTFENVMTIVDFRRMMRYADKLNKPREKAIMQTLAGTGIRIGELQYFTVEALKEKHVVVENKGSKRDIPIPKPVADILKKYCKERNITSGIIFRTSNGTPISNTYLWKSMQHIAGQARVKKSKIHAHSFRHLFAVNFLEQGGNVLDLQAILGHKSLKTTAIYTRTTTKELAKKMAKTSVLLEV